MINRDIESTVIIKGQEFTNELVDQNSDQFKVLKLEIEDNLYNIFCNDVPGYAKCEVKVKNFNDLASKGTSKKMRGIWTNFELLSQQVSSFSLSQKNDMISSTTFLMVLFRGKEKKNQKNFFGPIFYQQECFLSPSKKPKNNNI